MWRDGEGKPRQAGNRGFNRYCGRTCCSAAAESGL